MDTEEHQPVKPSSARLPVEIRGRIMELLFIEKLDTTGKIPSTTVDSLSVWIKRHKLACNLSHVSFCEPHLLAWMVDKIQGYTDRLEFHGKRGRPNFQFLENDLKELLRATTVPVCTASTSVAVKILGPVVQHCESFFETFDHIQNARKFGGLVAFKMQLEYDLTQRYLGLYETATPAVTAIAQL